MNKRNDPNKSFDCVEMKHKAALQINKKTSKMSREEELAYWKSKTPHFSKKKSSIRQKD